MALRRRRRRRHRRRRQPRDRHTRMSRTPGTSALVSLITKTSANPRRSTSTVPLPVSWRGISPSSTAISKAKKIFNLTSVKYESPSRCWDAGSTKMSTCFSNRPGQTVTDIIKASQISPTTVVTKVTSHNMF